MVTVGQLVASDGHQRRFREIDSPYTDPPPRPPRLLLDAIFQPFNETQFRYIYVRRGATETYRVRMRLFKRAPDTGIYLHIPGLYRTPSEAAGRLSQFLGTVYGDDWIERAFHENGRLRCPVVTAQEESGHWSCQVFMDGPQTLHRNRKLLFHSQADAFSYGRDYWLQKGRDRGLFRC